MIDVSVIIITYNQEKTVRRTLESIRNQTTKYSTEIILADDDSSDSTREILASFHNNSNNSILIESHPNLGVVKNYALALHYCHGRYIMVCAGDDWWHNLNKIELQVSYMDEHRECVVCYGGYLNYYPATGVYEEINPIRYSGDLFESLLKGNFICAPTACIRKKAMDNINFDRFPLLGFMVEDYPSWLALSNEGDFHCIDEKLVSYTTQMGSINNCVTFEKKKTYLDNVKVYKTFFAKERGMFEKYEKIINDSYWYMIAEYAVRYGVRSAACDGYRNIKDKTIKIWMKYLLCRNNCLFEILTKKFNEKIK